MSAKQPTPRDCDAREVRRARDLAERMRLFETSGEPQLRLTREAERLVGYAVAVNETVRVCPFAAEREGTR